MVPFLKWAGGKRWIAPFVKDVYSELGLTSIVEPFCGAAAVSLYIEPKTAVLNDNNTHLVNLYNWVKNNGLPLKIDTTNTKEVFLENRSRLNDLIDTGNDHSYESAQLFYYLNRHCFNGLCRFNQGKGHFNVGYGKYKKPHIESDLKAYSLLMKDYKVLNEDFKSVILNAALKSLVFIDPPYFKTFTGYSQIPFTIAHQHQLAIAASICKQPVITTNSYEPEIVTTYKALGFDVYYYLARRTIACNGQRHRVKEMIATKNIPKEIVLEKAKNNNIELYESTEI